MSINLQSVGSRNRDGYVYLLMVLFVGIIALSVLGSYMLLSITAIHTSRSVQLSMQSLSNAHTCIERALLSLQNDMSYTGNETITLTEGTCTLELIGGSGSQDRTICATGNAENTTRRMEVSINSLLPMIDIQSWKEVTTFTQCS